MPCTLTAGGLAPYQTGSVPCRVLREEGIRVVLVNSNPATIMTDPGLADATYVEPITPEVVAKIIAKERPDALLPTMGGQTALNTALSLKRMGVLDRYNVEMIGAKPAAIDMAEDRALFREAMARIGLETPRSLLANATEIKDADRKKHEAARNEVKARLSGAELDKAKEAEDLLIPRFTSEKGVKLEWPEYEEGVERLKYFVAGGKPENDLVGSGER